MIAIACDHAAVELKQAVMNYLSSRGLEYKDFGCYNSESVDYPDYALKAANSVASGESDRGILICGTGIGMSMVANKVRGIRCALVGDLFSAKATREHNNANMLSLGARVTPADKALEIVKIFLDTSFSGELRHIKRIEKMMNVETFRT